MHNNDLALFVYNKEEYTIGNIRDILTQIGINMGDDICVHSQIFSFGKPLVKKEELLQILVEILIEQVGDEGTVIMPTFTYSFCNGEKYIVMETPSTVGVLTETFRKFEGVQRTAHPNFSFAVKGKHEKEYLDIGLDAFGLDSVYGKMMLYNGKIVLLGANVGQTAYYLAEEHVGVSHRYFKEFHGIVRYEDGTEKRLSIPYYVRDYECEHSDMSEDSLAKYLLSRGIQTQMEVGRGIIGAFSMLEMYEAVTEELKKDESKFLK